MSQFHLFPNLPLEIRLQIYTFALLTPRLVFVRSRTRLIPILPGGYDGFSCETICFSPQDANPVPPLLHTCSESRSLALQPRFYTRAFKNGYAPRYTYVNFAIDTIAMADYEFMRTPFVDRFQIRKLVLTTCYIGAFRENWLDGEDTNAEKVVKVGDLLSLLDLESLTVVCRASEWTDGAIDEREFAMVRRVYVPSLEGEYREAFRRLGRGKVAPEIKVVAVGNLEDWNGVEIHMEGKGEELWWEYCDSQRWDGEEDFFRREEKIKMEMDGSLEDEINGYGKVGGYH